MSEALSPRLAPRLAYVALAVREADRVAAVFEERLGLARHRIAMGPGEGITAVAIGDCALLLLPLGHAALAGDAEPGVHHLGFEHADPEGWVRRLKLAATAGASLVNGVAQAWLDPAATLGVRMRMGKPLGLPGGAGTLVERIDHLGVASGDNRKAVALYTGAMGFPLESQQTDIEVVTVIESFTSDKYGAVYRNRPPEPVGGLRVAFITVGDCELEFLENFDPQHSAEVRHDAAGTTKQDQGAIARYVARRGPGLHHLALKTPDIDRALEALERAALRVIDRSGRPGSRRARIGFVHPSALGGVLLHFVERDPL